MTVCSGRSRLFAWTTSGPFPTGTSNHANRRCDGRCAMAGIVVNGEPRDLDGVPLHTNALDFLRGCGLTGAKEGCAEGECGACSVMVARPAPDGSDATEWTAINSCLVPAAALDGQEVVTSEGLGSPDDLHPVQHEMAVRGGSQCGYCTPGFVCSMAAEYYRAGRAATNGSGPRRPLPRRRTASTCTPSAATCAAAPATGRSRTPRTRSAFPAADDALAARRTTPAPAPMATQLHDGEAAFLRPADLAEALQLLRRPRGRHRRRRQHRLGRRRQPPGRAGRAGRRRRPAAGAARLQR